MKIIILTCFLGFVSLFNVNAQVLHFKGTSDSNVEGYTDYWDIIVQNDSIKMFCSFKTDSLDIRANNRQYFGVLQSDSNNVKIKNILLYKTLYVDDCNKPRINYLYTDTLSMYFDSGLIKQCHFELEFKAPNKPVKLFHLTNPFYTFPVKKNLKYTLAFTPDSTSDYRRIIVHSKQKCAVMIGTLLPSYNYQLYQTDEGFFLYKMYPNYGECHTRFLRIKLHPY